MVLCLGALNDWQKALKVTLIWYKIFPQLHYFFQHKINFRLFKYSLFKYSLFYVLKLPATTQSGRINQIEIHNMYLVIKNTVYPLS